MRYNKALLNIIEAELGERWLNKKVNQAKRIGKWNYNPIPRGWYRLKKRIIEQVDESIEPLANEEKKVIKLATDLEKIRCLKNYTRGIPSKKLKDSEVEKYSYLANVAALASEAGYTVEFVLECDNKTPDLHLATEKTDFYIECKKKDKYLPKSRDSDRWKDIQEEIINLLEKKDANYSVVIIVTGDMPRNLESEVYEFLEHNIPKYEKGVFTNNNYGFSVALHKLEDSYDDFGVILPTTPGGTYGAAIGKLATDEQGRQYFKKRKRVQLYVFDAHDISGISSSFLKARSQIPKDSLGIIYVDIDVSNVARNDLSDYFEVLNTSIKTILMGCHNRRLGAIVISAEKDSGQYIYRTVRNPHSDFSIDTCIPGEMKTERSKTI